MAGSIKWMVYTTDQGEALAVKCDESNGNLAGFQDYEAGSGAAEVMPRGFKMRGVNLISENGLARRRLHVGSVTNGLFTGDTAGVALNGIQYQVTSTFGEKRPRPFALDTALNDGTDA